MSDAETFAEETTGIKPPRSFILDAAILDMEDTHKVVRDDVKQNRIEYFFPGGLNKVDLFEECRALTALEDFDTMYNLTMLLLEDKDVVIRIKNYDDSKTELAQIHVVDKDQNLRGYDVIDEYPVLITWLAEFIAGMLLKKYPVPGPNQQPQPQAPNQRKKRTKKTPSTPETPPQTTP
jgi:hypothetical protein